VAILSASSEVVCNLIDAGARMTARLADGKLLLHLAAQMDQLVVIQKLLERSAINTEKATEEHVATNLATASTLDRDSNQDDWSSQDTLGIHSLDEGDDSNGPGQESELKTQMNVASTVPCISHDSSSLLSHPSRSMASPSYPT
jgi:hypothetical protein